MALIKDIWRSFRALPLWVQIWVGLILVPVNMAAILFLSEPNGLLIATLAIGGMAPNLFIMIKERGLSKAMALPHLLIWTPLVVLLAATLGHPEMSGPFQTFVWLLLLIDLISLGFDCPDAWKWWKGERAIAGAA